MCAIPYYMRSFLKTGLAALVIALSSCGSSDDGSFNPLLSDVSQTDQVSQSDSSCTVKKFFPDKDHDGYGDKAMPVEACNPPLDYVFVSSLTEFDCKDNDKTVHPHACEIPNNFIDDNCNGTVDEKDDIQVVSFCPPYDIVFVIDDSGSMLENDPGNMRYVGLKNIQLDGDDRATLISFSGNTHLLGELTTDQEKFQTYVEKAQSIEDYNGTDIVKALDLAITQFDSKDRKKAIILITDGENTDVGPISLDSMHKRAVDNQVEIYSLGIRMDENFLKKVVADIGMFFKVYASSQIPQIFNDIFSNLQLSSWLECSSETEMIQKFGECGVPKSCMGLEGNYSTKIKTKMD